MACTTKRRNDQTHVNNRNINIQNTTTNRQKRNSCYTLLDVLGMSLSLIQRLQSVYFVGFVLAFQVLLRADLVSFYRFTNLFILKQQRAR